METIESIRSLRIILQDKSDTIESKRKIKNNFAD